MFLHLVWMFCVLSMLSVSYIVSFHFQPVLELWQRNRSYEHFRHELNTSLALDAQIVDHLNRVLSQAHADRAYVFRYHNGIPAVQGVPFIFHTNTHEVIRAGVPRLISMMQRIPSSINVTMNQEFAQGNCVVLSRIDLDNTSSDYWYYQSRGTRSMIRCPLHSEQGDLLGFVGLDYLSVTDTDSLHDAEHNLRRSVERISRIMRRG